MDLSNREIFIIGGAGLIGSHICDLLIKTNVKEVLIYDNLSRGNSSNLEKVLEDKRFSLVNGDILYGEQLKHFSKGYTDVIHLAAIWLNHCQEFPQEAFQQNLIGTNNVFKICIDNNISNIVFSSSASVYGNPDSDLITEESPYNNTTFYGATKIAGEHLLKAYCNKYNINGTALRYFNVYGPRQDYQGAYISVVTKMVDAALSGNPLVIYGNGKQSFDFIYVKDIARANLAALQLDVGFNYFNVCTGKTISILEIAKTICEICEIEENFEYKEHNFPVSFRRGCPIKASKGLSFLAQTDLKEGLTNLINWIRDDRN